MTTREDPFASVAALPGVADAVAAARDAVDRLSGHGVLRLRQADVAAETALRGARASAALEGADVELDALRSGAAFDDPVAGPTARAAVRISTEYGLLTAVWARAPRQALARLHVVAGADAVDPDALGRPSSAAAAARLDQLADLLLVPTTAPAIVVAALVHGEILAANAFGWGNGLVARAAGTPRPGRARGGPEGPRGAGTRSRRTRSDGVSGGARRLRGRHRGGRRRLGPALRAGAAARGPRGHRGLLVAARGRVNLTGRSDI